MSQLPSNDKQILFIKEKDVFFSNESQLFSDSKDTTEQLLLQQTNLSMPDILLEKKLLNKYLYLSLSQLTDKELFILKQKHLKKQSDAEIGRKLHCNSQAISKKKRAIYSKLKNVLSP